jgi:hypothetical protein
MLDSSADAVFEIITVACNKGFSDWLFHHQWLYSPCKDLDRLTPEVS